VRRGARKALRFVRSAHGTRFALPRDMTNTQITVTFRTYSPILKQTFTNVKTVRNLADFNLYARSLYSGNFEIVSVVPS
jgi:hypothetical protein